MSTTESEGQATDETGPPEPDGARPAPSVWARTTALLSPGEGPPLRQITAAGGTYPLVVITTLNVVDELDRAVLGVRA